METWKGKLTCHLTRVVLVKYKWNTQMSEGAQGRQLSLSLD